MSEENPWKKEPLPDAQVAYNIVNDALNEWINKLKLPYAMRNVKYEVVHLRQREIYEIHKAVNMVLANHADEITNLLKKQLGETNDPNESP